MLKLNELIEQIKNRTKVLNGGVDVAVFYDENNDIKKLIVTNTNFQSQEIVGDEVKEPTFQDVRLYTLLIDNNFITGCIARLPYKDFIHDNFMYVGFETN